MKKFLVVLLSLGLLVAFGATASAADVKFGGSYYVVGVYDNNAQLVDLDRNYSRAFFYQRIRIQPVFQIAEGVTFTTRFDAMEKQWGQTDWRTSGSASDDMTNSRRQTITSGGSNNPKIQENIEFERGYLAFATAIGVVQAGYMSSGKWATDYGDDENSRPRLRIDGKLGPVNWGIVYEKNFESDIANWNGTSTSATTPKFADADNDNLALYGIYNFKGGSAGILYKFTDNRYTRPASLGNYRTKTHSLLPYIKATFGPIYLEGELVYGFGKAVQFDSGTSPDQDIDVLGAYLKVQANLGPAYFGVLGLYSQGDDNPADTTVKTAPGSPDLNVGLILGRDELFTWENSSGHTGVNGAVAFDGKKFNVLMLSAFGGYNPTPKINVEAMFVYAQRDKKPTPAYVSKDLGYEFDITASYKIYDNLTYMVGAGYLWTGDYFKGTSDSNKIGNDYLLMNKLSVSF